MKKVGRSKLRRDLTDPSLTPQLFQTHFIDSAGNHGSAKWKFYVLKRSFLYYFPSIVFFQVQSKCMYICNMLDSNNLSKIPTRFELHKTSVWCDGSTGEMEHESRGSPDTGHLSECQTLSKY